MIYSEDNSNPYLPTLRNCYSKYGEMGISLPPIRNLKPNTELNLRILAQTKGKFTNSILRISRTWDQGNKKSREKILEEFITNNQNKTGPQLELELANGASLFLTRITTWLRLTYLLAYDISLQLKAISIFISASGGHRFLAEFLEVGGYIKLQLKKKINKIFYDKCINGIRDFGPTTSERSNISYLKPKFITKYPKCHKAEALRLLISIANSGRTFKEFICESYGVKSVSDCLSRTKSDIVGDYCRNLLHQLGIGNPKFLSQIYKALVQLIMTNISPLSQQMAAQALRLILPSIRIAHKGIIDAGLVLLKSSFIQIQYEGYELLKDLVKRPTLRDQVIGCLIAILRIPGEDVVDTTDKNKVVKKPKTAEKNWQLGMGLNNSDPGEKKGQEKEAFLSIYSQQAYAAKLLGGLAANDETLIERMIQLRIINGLLNTISNVNYPDCQKYAANTLQFLVENYNVNLKDYMGQTFADLFNEKPDTFYRELNVDQILFLRNNLIDVHVNTTLLSESLESLEEAEAKDADSDDETIKAKGKKQTDTLDRTNIIKGPRDTSTNSLNSETDQNSKLKVTKSDDAQFDESKTKNIQELVKTMYTPYDLMTTNPIYAGSKFNKESTLSSNEKFLDELDKMKSRKKMLKVTREEEVLILKKETKMHMENLAHDEDLFKPEKEKCEVVTPEKEVIIRVQLGTPNTTIGEVIPTQARRPSRFPIQEPAIFEIAGSKNEKLMEVEEDSEKFSSKDNRDSLKEGNLEPKIKSIVELTKDVDLMQKKVSNLNLDTENVVSDDNSEKEEENGNLDVELKERTVNEQLS
ncbi:hypothetical protein HDU92_000806 [Lobulomyces angularis]|nr:hypothetical protein HDU92_000806 [Lobulomyces angularis]